jgi:hypothetical protein
MPKPVQAGGVPICEWAVQHARRTTPARFGNGWIPW